MTREPSYPDDAPVDPPAGGPPAEATPPASARAKRLVTGAAIGIGSAALVAALLYANRSRNKSDKA
jgi:hypothetical protein